VGCEERSVRTAARGDRLLSCAVGGFALVALAGIVIVISSFLPWIRVDQVAVEELPAGSEQSSVVEDFSGWEIAQHCAVWNGPTECSIDVLDGRQSVVAGTVTAGLGVVLLACGVTGALFMVARRRSVARVVSLGACFAAGVASGFTTFFWWTSGRLHFRGGVWAFAAATMIALLGSVLAAVAPGSSSPARRTARVLGVVGLLVLGWFGAVLLWTA
jgi:hypothetical protein